MTTFQAPQLRIVATDRRETTTLATPEWYRAKCRAQATARWRHQLTDGESTSQLAFWHRLMVVTEWR